MSSVVVWLLVTAMGLLGPNEQDVCGRIRYSVRLEW